MTTFIPTNPTDPGDQSVANLPFWPLVDMGEFRERYRIDDTVTPSRALDALHRALIAINKELETYKATQEAAGKTKLEEVEADTYGEGADAVHALVHHYQSAIYSRAKAHILEEYRDFDATKDGHDRADGLEGRIDGYYATARTSIRAITGRSRSTIELI